MGLAERAELAKITALLGVAPDQVDYLRQFDADSLRRFREDATNLMFDANRPRLEGFAAATRLLPTGLAAKISLATVPGSLAGLVAGLLDPDRALDLARKLPASYVADMTPYLDPRRVQPILSRVPAALVTEVTKVLSERGDYLSISRTVGLLPDSVVRMTLPLVSDALVIRAAFVMDDDARLQDLVALIPEVRQVPLLRAAQTHGLWPELLGVLVRIDPALRGQFAAAAAADGTLLDALCAAAEVEGYPAAAQQVLDSLSPQLRAQHAERAANLDSAEP